jgi:hypothetical protein
MDYEPRCRGAEVPRCRGAEVPLWCTSGPIARRWIVTTCVWKLSDCKNGSECWKIATRGPVGRIL